MLVLPQQVQGCVPHCGHVFRCVSRPHPAFVLPEGHIPDPMDRVLNAPMTSRRPQEPRGLRFQAGNVVPALHRHPRSLPPFRPHHPDAPQAGPVPSSAQVLQAGRVADGPAFPSLDAPVALVRPWPLFKVVAYS